MIPAIIAGASLLGKLFSGGAKGAEQSRNDQNNFLAERDRTMAQAMAQREQALENRAQLDLTQRSADSNARQAAYENLLKGDRMLNFTPASRPHGVANISFVHGPGALGKQAIDEMSRQAILKQLNGEKFDPLPTIERFQPTDLKQPSTLEKLGGILGLGLQGFGAVAPMFGQRRPYSGLPDDTGLDNA